MITVSQFLSCLSPPTSLELQPHAAGHTPFLCWPPVRPPPLRRALLLCHNTGANDIAGYRPCKASAFTLVVVAKDSRSVNVLHWRPVTTYLRLWLRGRYRRMRRIAVRLRFLQLSAPEGGKTGNFFLTTLNLSIQMGLNFKACLFLEFLADAEECAALK